MLSMFFLRTFPLKHGLGENRPSARFAFDTGSQSNASRVNSRNGPSWYLTVLSGQKSAYLCKFSAYLWASEND
jgi:hypothetical protein